MLTLSGLFCLAILALPIFLSNTLPIAENGRLSSVSSGDGSPDKNYGGINIPNPSISLGIRPMREIRAYMTSKLRNKQQRSPESGNQNPLPAAATNTIQPHKAPVPDSTFTSINSASQQQNPSSANQLSNGASAGDPDNGGSVHELNNALRYVSGSYPNKFNNAIRNIESASSATPSPIVYTKDGVPITSEDSDPYSLSHSLGTVSHSQFEAEDYGKGKRDQPDVQDIRKYRKKTANATEDKEFPTIWNGEVSVDDLDDSETEELDTLLEVYEFVRKYSGKPPPNSSSSAAAPPIPPPTVPTALVQSMAPNNTSKPDNLTTRNILALASPPLGDSSSASSPSNSAPLLHVPLVRYNRPKTRRDGEDKYSDPLEPVDISDEAYEEFRKQYPAFFGGGRKKERSLPAIFEGGRSVESRDPVSPNWLAMLFSPSAFLEKRPVNEANSVKKKDNTQGAPDIETRWVPNEVSIPPKTPPSSPRKRAPSSSGTSDAHSIERRDILSQYKNSMTNEGMRGHFAHRREGWLKAYQNDPGRKKSRRTPATQPVRQDDMYAYATTMTRHELNEGEEVSPTDEWFEVAFTKAWNEEHSKRNEIDSEEWFESSFERAWEEENSKRTTPIVDSIAVGKRDDYLDIEHEYDIESLTAFWDWFTEFRAEQARKNAGEDASGVKNVASPQNDRRDVSEQSA